MAIKDKTGNRYGKLVVKKMLPQYKDGKTYCLCDCDCGTVDKPIRTSLLNEKRDIPEEIVDLFAKKPNGLNI